MQLHTLRAPAVPFPSWPVSLTPQQKTLPFWMAHAKSPPTASVLRSPPGGGGPASNCAIGPASFAGADGVAEGAGCHPSARRPVREPQASTTRRTAAKMVRHTASQASVRRSIRFIVGHPFMRADLGQVGATEHAHATRPATAVRALHPAASSRHNLAFSSVQPTSPRTPQKVRVMRAILNEVRACAYVTQSKMRMRLPK